MRLAHLALLGVALVAGCDAGPLDGLTTGVTGLRGQVVRGPVQPVCEVPCADEPFSAGFSVRRAAPPGAAVVGTFRSDVAGRFAVALDPGAYTVVPDADAPLLSPASQGQAVVVAASRVTEVVLAFDTGIR